MLKTTHPDWIVRLYEWFHAHLENYVDCRPIDSNAMIQSAGYSIEKQAVKRMWGLQVQVGVATRE
jgi:hypothetical protein